MGKAKEDLDEEDRVYKLGQSSGLEEAGHMLMKRATERFENGDDKTANVFRECALVMLSKAKERHPGARA